MARFSRGEWETRLEGPDPDVGALKRTPAARILAQGRPARAGLHSRGAAPHG